ncbi:low molecular weight phosphotyrosine protein phosphatase [Oceanispirochaeta crateris]|uniref:protein-tyrosine-phosphatase n=1 Tax=Oceanispirochaeta crateris TaxID=2518645 RepID=A0A5C1QGB5_9SPIO|nr:low molecular weight protein-tyrosine-phosphatase [Oceanispirochaeta crateris]QEN07115.1 low molecular weight phosphotyrosine protein phosphatase [Oceanispirochaeta crateris]
MSDFKVMFVCLGNICRSPLAHAVFQQRAEEEGLNVFVESCGTGAWHIGEPADSRMRRTAQDHGVVINHLARKFQPSDLDEYDLIIPMDRSNRKDLLTHARPVHQEKIHLMREWDPQGGQDVPDPWYGGPEGFETVYDIVDRSCRVLIDQLKKDEKLS